MDEPPVVTSLRRYPVKSMLGEVLPRLDVDARGCVGDRVWSVRTPTGKIGSGKNSQRFAALPGLLGVRARCRGGRVLVTFPDGTSCEVDDPEAAARLSRLVGRPVTFEKESSVVHFDDGPVSLVGTASLAALAKERRQPVDAGRFRANVLLETTEPFVEDGWVGHEIRLGTALLRVLQASPRCVMVNMKTADLDAQPGNLAALGRIHDACLGVIAEVVSPGVVDVGDVVTVG